MDNEPEMREILAGEFARQRERSEECIVDRTEGIVNAALRSMAAYGDLCARKERERCAKVARAQADGEGDNDMFDAGWDAACEYIASAIHSLKDERAPTTQKSAARREPDGAQIPQDG